MLRVSDGSARDLSSLNNDPEMMATTRTFGMQDARTRRCQSPEENAEFRLLHLAWILPPVGSMCDACKTAIGAESLRDRLPLNCKCKTPSPPVPPPSFECCTLLIGLDFQLLFTLSINGSFLQVCT
ncbi:hypothetical protein J6590_015914 [Homalodisca vitripennis]|nr:hypothetical protein J6590_015914 [Homalodisca vitripennis]